MTLDVVSALIAAAPPTAAALLAFAQARSAQRAASAERAAAAERTIAILGGAIERLQSAAERIECSVADLRERVARVEGATGRGRTRV